MANKPERDSEAVNRWMDFAVIILVGSYVSIWAWLQADLPLML